MTGKPPGPNAILSLLAALCLAAGAAAQAGAGRLHVESLRFSRPVVYAGEPVDLLLDLENRGSAPLRGPGAAVSVPAEVLLDPPEAGFADLPPGGRARRAWRLSAARPGAYDLKVTVYVDGVAPRTLSLPLIVAPPPGAVDTREDRRPGVRRDRAGSLVFRNRSLVAVVLRAGDAYGPVLFYPATRGAEPPSDPVAAVPALAYLEWESGGRLHGGAFLAEEARVNSRGRAVLRGSVRDGGVSWRVDAELWIGPEAWLSWSVRARPESPAALARFSPMPLRAGRAGPREALFPGAAYLEGEAALPGPLVPEPHRITVPLMALAQGDVTTGLLWDQRQSWGGGGYPAALFDTPRRGGEGDTHRMELALPPAPPPGREPGAERLPLRAGQTVRLAGKILVLREQSDPAAAVRQWSEAFGPPILSAFSRPLADGRRISRQAYTRTLWNPDAPGWRVTSRPDGPGPAPRPFPVIALEMDAALSSGSARRADLRPRAGRVLAVLRERGPLDPRLAYRAGGVFSSLAGERARMQPLLDTQLADGGWPGPGGRGLLATAARARDLLRYAALTGDSISAGAGRRALDYIDRSFRLPGGSGAVELDAASAAAECSLLGWKVAGESRYLRQARYWADTGLTFVYFWGEPERPALMHAAVGAYGASAAPRPEAAPVPALEFARVLRLLSRARPDGLYDFVSEGILSSALRMQHAAGPQAGLIPTEWDLLEGRARGAGVDPEPLLAALYAQVHLDTGVATARLGMGPDRLFAASGASIRSASASSMRLRLRLKWLEGEETFTTVFGVPSRPLTVEYNTSELRRLGVPVDRSFLPAVDDETRPGWYHDPAAGALILRLRHGAGEDSLEIRWPDPAERSPVLRLDARAR